MPILAEIATAQPALQSHFCALRAQTLIHGRFSCAWKSWGLSKELNFDVRHLEERRGGPLIKAVATLEPTKGFVQNKNGQKGCDVPPVTNSSSFQTIELESSREDLKELDEREKMRRLRISKANKGNTPWNKGRKHSAETLQRIRERTKLAMQDPKVKMKLSNLGHAQSKETRMKIAVGVRVGWQKRREKLMVQEGCCFEWQNLIAEASRGGSVGEEELQWDSYRILDEQLKEEWLESVEQRKLTPRPKGSKRAPKSLEQRRKISEAISAKWADPEYRDRVCSGLAKYHGIEPGTERKPRTRPSGGAQTSRRRPIIKKRASDNNYAKAESKIKTQRLRLRRNSAPQYIDPLASSKLEMIKDIRAKRAVADTKKTEAIERARLLIVEAQKAAKALEVAAMKSPIARASLMETRELIAEAIQSIESIETGQITFHENGGYPSAASNELISQVQEDTGIEVNGTSIGPSKDEDFNLSKFTLLDFLNNEEKLLPTSFSGPDSSPFSFENIMKQSGSRNLTDQPEPNGISDCGKDPLPNGAHVQSLKEETPESLAVTKKWVCGRLIDVAEGP